MASLRRTEKSAGTMDGCTRSTLTSFRGVGAESLTRKKRKLIYGMASLGCTEESAKAMDTFLTKTKGPKISGP